MSRRHLAIDRRRWERVRRAALERANYRCQKCGHSGRLDVHHVTPLYLGGAVYDEANLAVRCRSCHQGEHERQESPQRRAWLRLVKSFSSSYH